MENRDSGATLSALRGARLFRSAPEAVRAELAKAAHCSRFDEGQALWRAGEPADRFTVITRGLVAIERHAPSGQVAVVGVFGPRESIGDMAAVEDRPFPADAVAVTETEVISVPAALVRHRMENSPELSQAVRSSLLEHTRALVTKIDILSAGSVPARLALLLLHLNERFGDENEAGVASLPIPLTRTALARLVSARSETVIRALSAMQKSGVLTTVPSGFEFPDLERLKEVARQG